MSSSPSRIPTRRDQRFKGYRDLSITYEGRKKQLPVKAPDISIHGMFVNTSDHFPEGAVLRVRFYLNRSNFEVNVRSEVRYCLPGVGIGVEFLDISAEAQKAILEEFADQGQLRPAEKP